MTSIGYYNCVSAKGAYTPKIECHPLAMSQSLSVPLSPSQSLSVPLSNSQLAPNDPKDPSDPQ